MDAVPGPENHNSIDRRHALRYELEIADVVFTLMVLVDSPFTRKYAKYLPWFGDCSVVSLSQCFVLGVFNLQSNSFTLAQVANLPLLRAF